MANITQFIGLQFITVSTFVKIKKYNLLSDRPPAPARPPAVDKAAANAFDYPDIRIDDITAEAGSFGSLSVFQSLQPEYGGDDNTSRMNIDTAIGGLIPVVYGVNMGYYLPDDYGASETAQNAGMSIELILSRFAAGEALPVQARNMRSDESVVSNPADLENAQVSKSSVFDAIDQVRDARSRKASYDASKSVKSDPAPTPPADPVD